MVLLQTVFLVVFVKFKNNFHPRNINEEEQVALWREGRRRSPIPVEIDF